MAKTKQKRENTVDDSTMKRARPDQSQGRVDPTYGQRSAIPGLDDADTAPVGDDGELDYGNEYGVVDPAAVAYLKAVRLQASGIPTLLVAPKAMEDRSIYEDGLGDARGYYADGAYTAAPEDVEVQAQLNGGDDQDIQRVYHNSILERYSTLQSQLATVPPRPAVEALTTAHPTHMGNSSAEWRSWRWRLRKSSPKTAQLACMEKGTVLRLLRLCTREMGTGTRKGISTRLSRWLWGLLARLPHRGELTSEEIGLVREVGKRAVWVGVKIKGVYDMAGLDEGQEDDEEEGVVEAADEEVLDSLEFASTDVTINTSAEEPEDEAVNQEALMVETNTTNSTAAEADPEDGEEDLEAARGRLLANLQQLVSDEPPSTDNCRDNTILNPAEEQAELPEGEEVEEDEIAYMQNTKVTIDMVITVVGYVYGQRDLLEFREVWD